MKRSVILSSLAALAAGTQASNVTRSLAAETWSVTNEYGNITVPGKFPSHVHLDLYAAQVISKSNWRCLSHWQVANAILDDP